MKKIFLFAVLAFSYSSSAQQQKVLNSVTLNPTYSKAKSLDSILQSFAPSHLPGASIAVYSETEGWWATTAGYANVEQKELMRNDHLQYLQSVSKMYMAIAILKLKEQGKIDIEQPIVKYLPKKYTKYLPKANEITVRMLLNHTSGIPEYNEQPEFLSKVILHPLRYFSLEDCLKAIQHKELLSKPGSKYRYINTNYILLALIADAITGDHAAYIRKYIFEPLNLNDTYYENSHNFLKGLLLPASYWDVFNSNIPVDVSPLQQMTVASTKGDDGIVCTTVDAVKFLKGLMEGKLLHPDSMAEMMHFVKDEAGNDRYGMGMIPFNFEGVVAYGHGGGGIGAGCALIYIPTNKTYVFFSTNAGVFSNGILPEQADKMKTALLKTLLN